MHETSQRQQGGMAAVLGLDELTLEEICRETGAYISNINAPDQVVIAGEKIALARAMDLASVRGAKRLISLQVSGAFHTDLMRPAVAGMQQAVSEAYFHDASVPIIANCDATPITSQEDIKQELLTQVCSTVQWKDTIDYMVGSGVNRFLEIGPGRALSSMVKRINRRANISNVTDLDSILSLRI